MNILVLGSGGREHVFAWKLSQSPLCDHLYIAPGNAGTAIHGTNVDIKSTDLDAIGRFCKEHQIDLLVPGNEDPLVAGVVDHFRNTPELQNILVVGPDQYAAQLEGSKEFAKEFMVRHGIPTAAYASFTAENVESGKQFLATLKPPYVLKADGLAAGKGVLIINDLEEACAELESMLLNQRFGAASAKVVIEEYLHGIELSVFVLTDGKHWLLLPEAKDYKRIGEGDTGPNTGGMGAVSPVPFADSAFLDKVTERIVIPTVNGFAKDGMHYRGFVFIGLMNVGGDPYVIEYNVRMGDPETEVVFPRLHNDLAELLLKCAKAELSGTEISIDPRTATTVIAVSMGYPGAYETGKKITGLENVDNCLLFHAGTKAGAEGSTVTSGGRVLAFTGLGNSIQEALNNSYAALNQICFDNISYRKDIGQDLLAFSSSK